MGNSINAKMMRQLEIYMNIQQTEFHGPDDLMRRFKINRRMLQRDLKDLRDAGVIRLKLDKKHNNYIESDKPPVFDESATGRHRQHLVRLNRIATLIDELERTDVYKLEQYESEYNEYLDLIELSKEDPITFPPESIGDPPVMPHLTDVNASYYSLFPDSNERMRQRDYQALNELGYEIHYSRKYKTVIFKDTFWDY